MQEDANEELQKEKERVSSLEAQLEEEKEELRSAEAGGKSLANLELDAKIEDARLELVEQQLSVRKVDERLKLAKLLAKDDPTQEEKVQKLEGKLEQEKSVADAALAAIDSIKNEIAQKVQDTKNEIDEAKAELKKAQEEKR